jgi:hypothetical protein
VSVVELTDAQGLRSAAALSGLRDSVPGRAGAVQELDGLAGAPGRAAVLSRPIVTGPFRVAGLSWDHDGDLAPGTEIHLRVRESGAWSDWLPAPDERSSDSRGRNGTVPFVTGGADALQVHISGNPADLPRGLDLNVIQADGGADLSASPSVSATSVLSRPTVIRPMVMTSVDAAVLAQPAIVDRAGWGADESLRAGFEASSAELRAAVVHHTAGTNSYTPAQSAQIVRDIYYLHAVVNDWGDVGYNFLVDRFGTVYEGRYGSISAPAGQMRVGAHAQGYNTYSMGIAAMGNYSSIAAEQAILDSMRDVIAWRFSSTPTLDMAAEAYFPANDFHSTDRYLPRIFGHRDVVATVCPGDDIEARIPALIASVTAAMGGVPLPGTNTAPVADAGSDRTVKAGSTVTLRGTGADADGDAMTFAWLQTGGVPMIALADSGTLAPSFVAPALPPRAKSLALTFTLTVTDSEGASGTDSVVVKVVKK